MCNQMIIEGKFPTIFKYANVTPVYKKGDKYSASNYRPIIIVHSLSKNFEQVLLCRMSRLLNTLFGKIGGKGVGLLWIIV